MEKRKAILLIGPTGSGKTPLGELLQARGFGGRRCHHFDFGQYLREVASDVLIPSPLREDELEVVQDSLRTGALLTDDHFFIAAKLMIWFLRYRDAEPEDLVVLNGLPRHLGQAQELGDLLDIRLVVYLSCRPEVISERIATNAGGDRVGRMDDDIASVREKLRIFDEQTAPVLGYYRGKIAAITLVVAVDTTAEDMWRTLNDRAGELLERTQ